MILRIAASTLATLLFALTMSLSCAAQYKPNVVFWGENSKCRSKRLVDESSKIRCSSVSYGGGKMFTVEVPGIRLSVFPYRGNNVLSVRAKIENKGRASILIDPLTWSVASYANEEDFNNGQPPIFNETAYERETKRATPSVTPQIVGLPTGSPLETEAPTRLITSVGRAETPQTPTRLPESAQRKVVTGETGNVGNSTGSPNVIITVYKEPSAFKDVSLTRTEIPVGKTESGATYFNLIRASSFQLAIIHVGEYSFVFAIR